MANWTAIREDYVQGDIGYRPLAEQYGVSFNTLKQVAKRESWAMRREEYRRGLGLEVQLEREKHRRSRTVQPEPKETETPPADKAQVKRANRVFDAADKLLNRIIRMSDDKELKPQDIKSLSGALRDIKEIRMIEDGIAPKIILEIEEECGDG